MAQARTHQVRTRAQLLAVAALAVVGYAATFLVAVHTSAGLRVDARLFHAVNGTSSGTVVARAGATALETIDAATLTASVLALAFLALVRGRRRRAFAAAAVVVCSVGSAELLKHGGAHVPGMLSTGREATFPSGHTSIAVSLGLALVLAVPPVLRGAAALVGAAYAAGIGLSVVVLAWHEPSDVVGSFFLCAAWTALAGALLGTRPGWAAVSRRGIALAVATVAGALAAAAVLAARHPHAVESARSRPALAATAALLGLLSLAVFGVLTPLLGEEEPS